MHEGVPIGSKIVRVVLHDFGANTALLPGPIDFFPI